MPGERRTARLSRPAAWAAALAAVTLLRLVVAASAPLSPDEAYYWVWSRALAASYLDHPPMVALWIRAGTALAGNDALGVRLLAPLSTALGSVLLADAGERLFPGRHAGLAAAALLNATLLLGVGGVIMTPDTPLIFFWTAVLWALARFGAPGSGRWLVTAGLLAGLALDSKYTAVFLAPGVLLWLVLVPSLRRWFATPYPWIAALAAAAAFVPVIWWNAAHGWASFLRQGGRAGNWEPARAARYLGELVGGQVGLATPLIFVVLAAGVARAVRIAWRDRTRGCTLVAALTVPPLLVFVEHALGDRVQANWPAVLYPSAALAGGALAGRGWARLRIAAIGLGAAVTVVAYTQATLRPLALSPHRDPTTLRLAGWPELAREVEAIRRQQGSAFVAADDYGIASELAWTLPPGTVVLGVEDRWRYFALPSAQVAGKPGLLLRSERRDAGLDAALWAEFQQVGEATRAVDGQTVERFRVYRVVARNPDARVVDLPSRETVVLD